MRRCIFFVMLVGGYIEIALETTAIQRGLRILISKMANKALILIPLVMLFFAILGATGVLINARLWRLFRWGLRWQRS